MEGSRLASLSLSKEVLEKTSQEVVDLLLRLLSRVEELESRLNKHSGNSDKPPSSDRPFRKRSEEKPTKKSVRQHAGFRQALLAPTETTPLFPQRCSCGGTHFNNVEPFYTHQFLELPRMAVHVEHLVLHRARKSPPAVYGRSTNFNDYAIWRKRRRPRVNGMLFMPDWCVCANDTASQR